MMTNLLQTFERNRYFYGKLLTVRDFEVEQRYGIDKRQLINRLLHGSGVICGLEMEVKDDDLRIYPGAALDCYGREIIVPTVHVKENLSVNLGEPCGDPDEFKRFIYLVYQECDREPIPGVANASSCKEVCEANRVSEGFEVRVLSLRPTAEPCFVCSDRTILYESEDIRLIRIAPRWVKPNDVFTVSLELHVLQDRIKEFGVITIEEKLDDKYLVRLDSDSEEIEIPILTSSYSKGLVWSHSYIVQANNVQGSTQISSLITIGKDKQGVPAEKTISTIDIMEASINRKMTEDAFTTPGQGCCTCNKQEDGVLIGSIEYNAAGKIIDVDSRLNREYVYTNPLLYDLQVKAESRAGQLPPFKSLQKVFSGLATFKQISPGEKRISEKISYPVCSDQQVWISLELELDDGKRIAMGESSELQQNYYPLLTVVHSACKKKFQIIVEDRRKNAGKEEGKEREWSIRWFAMPVTEQLEDKNIERVSEISPLEQRIITLLTLSEPLLLEEIVERLGTHEDEVKPALEQLVKSKVVTLSKEKYSIK